MPWKPVTLDTVRTVVNHSRVDRALDSNGPGELVEHFNAYHLGTVAAIRAKIANSHAVDEDERLIPPEFIMLAALRIAAILLGRPGLPGNDQQNVFGLSQGQLDELKRLEEQLQAVSEGDAVTKPENPEEDPTASSGQERPNITEKTRVWSKCDQDGMGAYG